jgi:hypothetical protein
VVGENAPGVATLRPCADAQCLLTLKPGSYPWPDGWWSSLVDAAGQSAHQSPTNPPTP